MFSHLTLIFEYIIFLCIADVKDVGLFSICVYFVSVERERGTCIAKTLTHIHRETATGTNTDTHPPLAGTKCIKRATAAVCMCEPTLMSAQLWHKMRRITDFLSLSICIWVNSTVKICQMWSTYAILSIQRQTHLLSLSLQISLISTQIICTLSAHCYCFSLQFCFDCWHWCWNDIKSTEAVKCFIFAYVSVRCFTIQIDQSLYVRTLTHIQILCFGFRQKETGNIARFELCKLSPKALPPSPSTLLLLPHALQARGHLFAISLFCPHAQCVYTQRVYRKYTRQQRQRQSCAFSPSLVYIALFRKWKWKFNWMLYNACTHTPNISKERRVFNIPLLAHTHSHTHPLSTHINSFELYFSFFFFVWVFPFPLLVYLWHTQTHTYIHYRGHCTPQIAIQFQSILYIAYRFMRVVFVCVRSVGKISEPIEWKKKPNERKICLHTCRSVCFLVFTKHMRRKLPSTKIL